MSEPKFENRPFERLKLDNFRTLREIFLKNLARFSQIWLDFHQIWLDFHLILVKIFENCEPLRRKFSIFVILGPFQRLTCVVNFQPFERLLRYKNGYPYGSDQILARTYPSPVLPKCPPPEQKKV